MKSRCSGISRQSVGIIPITSGTISGQLTMKQLRAALVNPPLIGHKLRGTGIYTDRLYDALKIHKEVDVVLVDIKDNLGPFDLVHYSYFDPFFLTLPFRKIKPTIVTVHDLIPFRFPQFFPKGIKGELKWQIQKILLKKSDAIITDSYSSREDIIKYASIDEKKIQVIYLGVGKEFKAIKSGEKLEEIKNRLKLPDEFILHVGDVNYNKNIKGLIKAFNIIKSQYPSLNLVLIGKGFVNPSPQLSEIIQLINSFELTDKVYFTGGFSTGDLVGIYNLAKIYIQPSFAEGFGLPVLEAMTCGCPVVTSDNTSLKEIVGNASVLINPHDVDDIAGGITEILSDKQKRDKLITEGIARSKLFSWEKCAEETIEVYMSVVN